MTTVADVTLPGDSFPLGRLLTEHPDMHIELERLVPLDDRILPFFWVTDGSAAHIESVLEAQRIVESVELLTTVEDRYLYQVTWTSEVDGVIDALLGTQGVILEGQSVGNQWEFRLRFPSHEQLSQFNQYCVEEGITVDIKSIYNPHVPSIQDQLTSTQWETLVLAYELGYYDVPRECTLTELAEYFKVSEQAVSQRLRRATNAVVAGIAFSTETTKLIG
ncbi:MULTISPECIES: helix-turn-helix domain-containing protein [unclassified Haladaptatus]|uniref:helix-turn-helix domain-containing protein n=1 Tax=unclassified Haladaptatus TaxID=2622732 RepID=UPI00209BFEF8|nr:MULTISPECIES: helix-turn-helix domain-containing protein [unclassified Haladaptatus]MCO8244938.1 helix-turn-helix domain-containing protein [Haladaptatus sp. AB643]MCO8255549.1 helix-turn-helix domain-containing protein [Haladaptatus sp. AB618]